jgi:hypothetical protein
MVAVQNDLSNWTQYHRQPLPEDICLWRDGESLPSLVSVTHEREAWILSGTRVELPGAYESEYALETMKIPRGRFFCRTE